MSEVVGSSPTRRTKYTRKGIKKMKAGEYYVGDLCYVFSEDQWSEVCSLMFPDNHHGEDQEGVFTLKDGTEFAIFGTLWGDGGYYDNQTTQEYCVDSGTIGCVLTSAIDVTSKYPNIRDLGNVVTFIKDFEPRSEMDRHLQEGNLYFGNTNLGQLIVDTAGAKDDEDYEEDYYDGEDGEDE
jgi:hypothetical protein